LLLKKETECPGSFSSYISPLTHWFHVSFFFVSTFGDTFMYNWIGSSVYLKIISEMNFWVLFGYSKVLIFVGSLGMMR